MDLNDLGTRIRKYRNAHKLSQKELAEKLNVSQPTVVLWETGNCIPSGEKLLNILKLLEIPDPETEKRQLHDTIFDLKLTVAVLKEKLRSMGGAL